MKLRFALFVLSLVIGVGACGGSILAFMSIEPLRKGQSFAGLESSMLQGTPFTTFLIPGVFLLIVLDWAIYWQLSDCGATKGIMANCF